jgi:protein-L-isoaspartate(D-aspartate) O-methyltransferase
MDEAAALSRERGAMIEVLSHEISDSRVLAAMAQVPREEFVLPGAERYAYADRAMSIGSDQTISQPLMVAIMTEALKLEGGERVLEVGTGSGYQAAILSLLAREVVSVERIAELRNRATATLQRLGYKVQVEDPGDELGWAAGAPYDAIVVTAGAAEVPQALVDQLAVPGRLVVPVGGRLRQKLMRVEKHHGGTTLQELGDCAFVPLIGESGFDSPT